MKKFFKNIVTRLLWYQVKKLRNQHKIFVIGVVGSIGKTSTKFAIAQALSGARQVIWQKGNYNDISVVPLVFFSQKIPSLFNPFSWLRIFIQNYKQIKNYPFDTVVLELGTDGPGQIAEFKKFLQLDIAVVTAIAPEHMEFFNSIDDVAKEEFAVTKFAEKVIINKDLINKNLIPKKLEVISYGLDADYSIALNKNLLIKKNKQNWLVLNKANSMAEAYSKVCAGVVADLLNVDATQITKQLNSMEQIPGRLQFLMGVKGSVIIDDTYNASPDAVINSLKLLYDQKTKYKIAILGSMNELGDFSKDEHHRIGSFCNPKRLELVVTVGEDANKYLASSAEENGCVVKQFGNPYDAGKYVEGILKNDTTILAKGSQNNVYLEEAVKQLLADPKDINKLVRQSEYWLEKKQNNFFKEQGKN